MKILICDDLPEDNHEFEIAILEADPETIIKRLHRGTLPRELNGLFENVKNILDADGETAPHKTEFDSDYDIVFLDNNLAYLGIVGARLTAEAVAGYIRAFSSSRYVVSLNKNPDVDFDLRYLMGDYETRADLALNTKHLSNLALWTHRKLDAKNCFLPSYWPRLNEIGQKRRFQIEFVLKNLNRPVLEVFEFDENAIEFLSRHATGTLFHSPRGKNNVDDKFNEVTFMDVFAASRRFFPVPEDRERIKVKAEENLQYAKQVVARVVAATIDHWFRRDVLGPQNVLVDMAHLLPRLPFLLGTEAGDINRWNGALEADDPLSSLDCSLVEKHLREVIFSHDLWVPSPCFWWNRLRDNEELNEFFFRKDTDWASVVFCEDRSEFVPRPGDDQSPPFEFAAEYETGSWNRRFVDRIEGFNYVPKSRFAVL